MLFFYEKAVVTYSVCRIWNKIIVNTDILVYRRFKLPLKGGLKAENGTFRTVCKTPVHLQIVYSLTLTKNDEFSFEATGLLIYDVIFPQSQQTKTTTSDFNLPSSLFLYSPICQGHHPLLEFLPPTIRPLNSTGLTPQGE